MSAVDHRRPAARPRLPAGLVTAGTLSDAQLESVVLAAEAHAANLPGLYRIDSDYDTVKPDGETGDGDPDGGADRDVDTEGEVTWSEPTAIRRGWMLGDGTGAGKGRQVAGIILDRWLHGSRRALWLSASDKLVEDAQRDWKALGGRAEDVFPINRWRQKDPVDRPAGILFATYSTLRSPARNGAPSRLEQMMTWLAGGLDEPCRHRWDGVIVFDESHALSNAAGGRGSRGPIAPSQQGRAGVRLQNALPQARIVYVSATGASTIDGLCYASRLGLWGTPDTPFRKRNEFVQAMEAGGVAALEIVARDLKALGRYQARALSYTGVEVDILEHALTDEQTAVYNEYARAFKIIHRHLGDALEATRIETAEATNARAKAAAHSAFEGAKQRFFNHLLTSMKCPTLIRAVENDLAKDRAPVIQLVSTGEALTERRIAQIPASEWDDLSIDITPREYVLDYLFHAFPVQLHEQYQDDEGNIHTRPMRDAAGNPVLSREAVAMRDALMERLGSLPPIGSALDQILHHFGHERVAEISGRSRRVLLVAGDDGRERLAVRTRAPSANLHETQAFMDGEKPVLVFSGAGNTGRSYHADLDCGNTRRRHHYLLEYGWRADQAIQGLGRTHRTHQRSAPVFRPVTTNVKGERRFTATIARRIHSLGAITRGQKDSQTGMGDDNAALFRECDNFESEYARAALRMFYHDLYAARVPDWSADRFETETGLRITDGEGQLLSDPPPMHTFLNRLLALEISEQNELFSHLERLVENQHPGRHRERHVQPRGRADHGGRARDRLQRDHPAERGRRHHAPRRDPAPRPPASHQARRRPRDPCARAQAEAPPGPREEPPVRQRRPVPQGPFTHPRGRQRPEALPPDPARQPTDRARRRPRGVVRHRRPRVAAAVGRAVRGAARVPRVPVLARDRRAAARLEEAPRDRRERLPPDHRRRDEPHRARAVARPGRRRPHEARPRPRRRRRPHDAGRTDARAPGAAVQVPPRRRPGPRRAAAHGNHARRGRAPRPGERRTPEGAGVPLRDRAVPHPGVRPRRRRHGPADRGAPRRRPPRHALNAAAARRNPP